MQNQIKPLKAASFVALCAAAAALLLCPGISGCQQAAAIAPSAAPEQQQHGLVKWQQWSGDLFARARSENKPVLLDLEAIWCHWCHVMEAKTYSDAKIAALLNEKFIAVKVDQDSRPDLSNKYQEYGWPATVIFKPSGDEIEIRSGYIPAKEMLSLLQSIAKHPAKVRPSAQKEAAIDFGSQSSLSEAVRNELIKRHRAGYDEENGGWGFEQKFLFWDTVEYALMQGKAGDAQEAKRAQETLKLQRKLIDPVWGGVYQYSTHGDWDHAHFEKIMQMQAENLRIYSLAYAIGHNADDLKAAQDVERYLRTFLLSGDGAFYTSQDADLVQGEHSGEYFKLTDEQRRKLGVPHVDQHIYARENGWAIAGLTQLYMVTGQKSYLDEAVKAADWIIAHRSLPGGGFAHDASDQAGPYLGDTLAMGRALLNLHIASGERKWLTKAQLAADFINAQFKAAGKASPHAAGFATSSTVQENIQGTPLLEENVMLARFANLLYRYSGNEQDKAIAKEAMRFLATPEIAQSRRILVAGPLLADQELGTEPAHITVVGAKDDPAALALFQSALKFPSSYKRIEWWDAREGALPNADVDYPQMKQAAAFVCVEGRCSAPVYKPEAIAALLDGQSKKQ